MEHENTPTVASICQALGRKSVALACAVELTAVSNAVVANRFPAKWFLVIDAMCREAGINCPKSLFKFIDPSPPPAPTQEDAA